MLNTNKRFNPKNSKSVSPPLHIVIFQQICASYYKLYINESVFSIQIEKWTELHLYDDIIETLLD